MKKRIKREDNTVYMVKTVCESFYKTTSFTEACDHVVYLFDHGFEHVLIKKEEE